MAWTSALLVLLVAAASASAQTTWLCRPGQADNPCVGDQTTTRVATDGTSRVEKVDAPADPAVDCFYVYPTVSNQPTTNAAPTVDPELRSIAMLQAQRFSTRCRVFAPVYRQVTAIGVSAASQSHDVKPYDIAYADVEQAFRAYLRDDNHGRGFVLVGHSQGSRMLRALLRRMIDPDPQLRDRLVTAIIPGANATAKDDTYIRGCTAPRQVGCVVAYSTFNDVPPDNTRFGRTDTDPVGHALGLPDGPVLCTDPTELSGDPGHLHSLVNTAPFAPGVIAALLLKLYGGPAPTADTPWLEPQDHYTAKCEPSNGANVLRIAPVGAARHLNPSPDETWGTHLVDVNLPLDNLLTFVSSATRSYLSLHRPLGARILRRRGHRVTVRISGPPWARVRVTLCRNGKMVGRRTARTGRRVVFRHVPRGGRLTVRAG